MDTAHTAHNGLETMGRIGFAAKGVVYVLIGVLALMAALGTGGDTVDSRGALSRLSNEPFGEIALVLIGVGLLGYAVWRMASALRDTENQGSDAKGKAKRLGHFGSGLVHIGLGVFALRLGLGNGGGQSGGGDQTQTWTARLLEAPAGEVLVVLIGFGVVAAGLAQINKGWKEKFLDDLRALPGGHEWVVRFGKLGYIARGVVFSIIGIFVVLAAVRHDSSNVRGMEGALDTLAAQPYGQLLLGVVAAGLACYGIYSFVESRYRFV
jgi:hypothetical protein